MRTLGKLLLLQLWLLLTLPGWGLLLPSGGDSLIWDRADLFYESMELKMDEVQQQLLKHDVKVLVVTIPSLSAFEAKDMAIEAYAAKLYDQKIRAGDANEWSILFLISKVDRKARIELGDAWGHDWDSECEHIMATSALPSFKRGDYDVGTVLTLKALLEMVEQKENPSFTSQVGRTLAKWGGTVAPYSPFPPTLTLPVLLVSLTILVAGFFSNVGKVGMVSLGGIATATTLFGGAVYDFFAGFDFGGVVMFLMIVGVLILLSWLDDSGGGFMGWSSYGSSYSSWDSGFGSGGGSFDFGGGGGFDFGGGGGATGDW